jgi:hypothetical protein
MPRSEPTNRTVVQRAATAAHSEGAAGPCCLTVYNADSGRHLADTPVPESATAQNATESLPNLSDDGRSHGVFVDVYSEAWTARDGQAERATLEWGCQYSVCHLVGVWLKFEGDGIWYGGGHVQSGGRSDSEAG